MPSIGVVANVYQEAHALPGWLESAARFFDSITIYHTGPNGRHSTDGTIELCERWGVRLFFGSINPGFGVVRTEAVHLCDTEWVMILDADERFHAVMPLLTYENDPDTLELYAQVHDDIVNQGQRLRQLIANPDLDAICTGRRHWHDMTWTKPTQDWFNIQDLQLRCVRNIPEVGYRSDVRMHEQIIDSRLGTAPRHVEPDRIRGPFHDHYHMFFQYENGMESGKRLYKKMIYDAIHEGRNPPMLEEFQESND